MTGLEGASDDHGNSRDRATALGPNASASGNLEQRGDVDYFRIRVAEAGTLRVETTGSTDTYGYLQDAGGGLLERDNNSGAGANFRISRRVSAGTHYVAIVGGPERAATGAYRLSVRFSSGGGGPTEDDHGNSRDRATALGPNASASGNLERRGDVDYFRIRVAAAGTLRVETTGSTDTYGYLQNAGGGLLERDDDSGANANFRISRRVSAGTHYVAIVGGPGRTATGAYRLSANFSDDGDGGGPAEDDHGNSRDQATTLAPNASAWGNLEQRGDVDYFRIQVAEAGTLRVRTTGSTNTYGYLQNAGGAQLGRDDDSGANANFQISRRVSAGTHYVAIVGGPGRSATGAYCLIAQFGDDASDVGCSGTGPGPGGMSPGSKFRDCPECPEMVVVPGGSFMMGSPPHEQDRDEDEEPVHEVRIGASFAAGVYELTFDEWDACVADGGCGGHQPGDEGWGRGRRPAINISWRDAQSYLEWLSGRTGENYRLLSESEWEYAARAGTATPFHTGSRITTDQANHDNSRSRTMPAGSFGANAFGLHDVHGNVWEWVQDCWNDSYEGAPGDGGAWEGGDCSSRVVRGGGWSSAAQYLRSANRIGRDAGDRSRSRGLRVARTLAGAGAGGGPVAGAAIPDQPSLVAGRDATLDLSRHFTDDQTLSYEARSSDSEVLRVSVTGSILTLMPVAEGRATVTVTARDPDGNVATQKFEVTVGGSGEPDPGPDPGPGPGPGSGGRAGEKFRDCDVCPEMVVVPAGTFMMGAPESEAHSTNDERPVHSVSVSSFAMGVHEVTFAEWDACVAEGGCGGHRSRDWGWGRGDRPVINMSWDDVQRYVEWLSGKTGRTYRLPSEAEWEYAARAGTRTPFHTGETISPQQANYDGRYPYPSGYDSNGLYRRQTLPVGSFPANAFGLHDVHGNVWEWVQDCWNYGYQRAPSDGSAWESGNCSDRVLRGGSWFNDPGILRSANRFGISTGSRSDVSGFRVARTL